MRLTTNDRWLTSYASKATEAITLDTILATPPSYGGSVDDIVLALSGSQGSLAPSSSNDNPLHQYILWTSIAGMLGLGLVASVALPSKVSSHPRAFGGSFGILDMNNNASASLTWSRVDPHAAPKQTREEPNMSRSPDTVAVRFELTAARAEGEDIFVVGSIPQMGSWRTDRAIALTPTSHSNWTAIVDIPPGAMVEYKFIKKSPDGSFVWEAGPNHTVTIPSGSHTIVTSWV